jgi:lysozyme
MRLFYLLSLLLLPTGGEERTGMSPPIPTSQLRGVDVSHHQKRIDWEKVVDQHWLDFAFVKATEGGDFSDSLFCHNWESLRRLGVRRGAYHFFRPYGCGYEQAVHFLQTVEMQAGDLAPVLDVETLDGMDVDVVVEEARIWLHTVEARLGVKPILYSNQKFYERFLHGHFDDYPLWIARYSEKFPSLPPGRLWEFWQYSNEGYVDGISRAVDLNMFTGTQATLDRLCWFPSIDLPEAVSAP